MNDWLKIGIMAILFVGAMYASHILVNLISPLLIVVAAVLMTFAILRLVVMIEGITRLGSTYFVAGMVLVFAASLIVAWILTDFIKIIAWFLIGWYIFRVLLYLIAEDIYRDIDIFIAGE